MPVAEYDSVSPAATSEKMAPVTPPLTTRVRNLVTLGRALPADRTGLGGQNATGRSGGAAGAAAPPRLMGASTVEGKAVVARERHHDVVGRALHLHDGCAVGRDVV